MNSTAATKKNRRFDPHTFLCDRTSRAGSAREDSVARLQSSVDVLHAIMAAPDKGIPEEVFEQCKMHPRSARLD